MIFGEPLSKAKSKHFQKLLQKKHRCQERRFLVEGLRLCQELLLSPIETEALVFCEDILEQPEGREIFESADSRGIPLYRTGRPELAKLGETCHPQDLIACARMRDHDLKPDFFRGHRFLVLFDVSDPGNVGTLLRTSEAFSWNHVLCVGQTADIYNPKVSRAAMGAAFRSNIACAPWEKVVSYFEDNNVSYVVSVPRRGQIPPLSSPPEKLALVLGNEAHGLPESLVARAHATVHIPTAGQVDSLNVAVAGSILLFLLQ